jgi:hypothetical protein
VVHAYSPDRSQTKSQDWFQLKSVTNLTLSRRAIISNRQRSRRWLQEFTSILLEGLCDVQAMTGMAITAAGLAQRNDISLYHLSMTYNLWLLTTNSLWAAQSPAFGSMRGYRNLPVRDRSWQTAPTWYQARLRGLCIMTSVTLGSLVQYEIVQRTRVWNHDESGHCYRPPTVLAPGSEWYFFAVRCIYLTDVIVEEFLEVLRVTRPGSQRLTAIRGPCQTLLELVQRAIGHLNNVQPEVPQHPTRTRTNAGSWILNLTRQIGSLLLSAMLWILLQWLATCAIGEGTPKLTILVYCAYTMWAMHDIIALKVRNRELIQGSESKWEFGQVLSMVLLVYILFSIMDACEQATNSRRHLREEQDPHEMLQGDANA